MGGTIFYVPLMNLLRPCSRRARRGRQCILSGRVKVFLERLRTLTGFTVSSSSRATKARWKSLCFVRVVGATDDKRDAAKARDELRSASRPTGTNQAESRRHRAEGRSSVPDSNRHRVVCPV